MFVLTLFTVFVFCWGEIHSYDLLSELNSNYPPDDAYLTVPEIITEHGYPVEVHHVTTPDGYILEMHRLPYGKKSAQAKGKPVVFIMHGILSSSADWIIAGPERGLGYLLADRGYDVWLGNARGNTYSKKHINLTPDDAAFWDFSWHEIGVLDLPAMIDYALEQSGEMTLHYIGYSQGTTTFYVMCSEKPEYNAKIKAMYSMAPIAYVGHLFSPLLRFMAPFQSAIHFLLKFIGVNEFLPSSKLLADIGSKFCSKADLSEGICTNSLFILCGYNSKDLDRELLPIIMGHTPAGSSTKQLLHYAQGINSGKFRKYDYGFWSNWKKYGSISPPDYDIKKITAPVALHYSQNDWMSSETDVMQLYSELPNSIGRFLVQDSMFNHLDYMWAKNVESMVYVKIFSLMEKYK